MENLGMKNFKARSRLFRWKEWIALGEKGNIEGISLVHIKPSNIILSNCTICNRDDFLHMYQLQYIIMNKCNEE